MSEEQLKEVFKANLKYHLERRGKTQNDLANHLKVSATTVNNWVKGYNSPRMDKIDDICKFLNIGRAQLIGASDEDTYYLDPETAKLAQEAFEDPDTRILLSAKRTLSPESMQAVIDMVKLLKKKENPQDHPEDFTDEEYPDDFNQDPEDWD